MTDLYSEKRTVLANERTALAYIRTGLTLLVAGASLVQFFDNRLSQMIGVGLIVMGLVTFILSALRFRHTHRQIRDISRQLEEKS